MLQDLKGRKRKRNWQTRLIDKQQLGREEEIR